MSDDEAARLHGLAQAATRGKWEHLHGLGVYCKGRILASTHTAVEPSGHNHDAAYIAAASPDVLLRLLDERDALRRERDAAMALLRECDEVAVSLCGVADLVEHGDLFARIDAILGGDKEA